MSASWGAGAAPKALAFLAAALGVLLLMRTPEGNSSEPGSAGAAGLAALQPKATPGDGGRGAAQASGTTPGNVLMKPTAAAMVKDDPWARSAAKSQLFAGLQLGGQAQEARQEAKQEARQEARPEADGAAGSPQGGSSTRQTWNNPAVS